MKRIMKLLLGFLVVVVLTNALLASGTGAGTPIQAPSVNLKVTYTDGVGNSVTKNASADAVGDWAESVKAIHGLVAGDILCPDLAGFVATTHLYTGVTANENYLFSFSFTNRSNEAVTADAAVVLAQNGTRWSMIDDPAKVIAEDAVQTFLITVNSGTAIAFQRVTLNVTTSITAVPSVTKNVVSYNAWTAAVGAAGDTGVYGGVDNIFNYYVLEAQGFELTVLSRTAEITAPVANGYAGLITDPVPGAKIKYTIAVRNDSSSVATDVDISDIIPNNCHLFFTDTPTVANEVANHWTALPAGFVPTANTTAGGQTISFMNINISPNAVLTLNYTVTID